MGDGTGRENIKIAFNQTMKKNKFANHAVDHKQFNQQLY